MATRAQRSRQVIQLMRTPLVRARPLRARCRPPARAACKIGRRGLASGRPAEAASTGRSPTAAPAGTPSWRPGSTTAPPRARPCPQVSRRSRPWRAGDRRGRTRRTRAALRARAAAARSRARVVEGALDRLLPNEQLVDLALAAAPPALQEVGVPRPRDVVDTLLVPPRK